MMKLFFPRMIDYDSISASCSKPGHRGLSDPCYASSHSYCLIRIFIVPALMHTPLLLSFSSFNRSEEVSLMIVGTIK
jgi:hypothetical protein